MDAYDQEHQISKLPEHLKKEQGLELFQAVQEWQKLEKDKLNAYKEEVQEKITDYFKEYRLEIPEGLVHCIDIIGRNLNYYGMDDDEALERSWGVFSIMLCLGYKGYMEKEIKKDYQEQYYSAISFIKENRITLPYYYVLVWDLWKSGKNQGESYKHNQKRIRENLAFLPEVYRDLLSAYRFLPDKERYKEDNLSQEDKDKGLIPMVRFLDDIHVYEILPSFAATKPKHQNCKDSIQHDQERKWRQEFYHPYPMMIVPCTELYRSDNLDVESYINRIYWEQRTQEIKEDLDKYELSVNEDEASESIDARLQVSKELGNKINIVPDKELLLHKLEKNRKKVGVLLQSVAPDTNFLERFSKYGFAKKTYYDLLKIKTDSEYKSIPAKDTVIALVCAMELDLDKSREILRSCGYIFSQSSERDVIIEHMIENKHWDVMEINGLLIALRLKPIVGRAKVKNS